MNAAQKATKQVQVIEEKVDYILNYFERGYTYDRNWLREQLTDVAKDVLDIERGVEKNKPKPDIKTTKKHRTPPGWDTMTPEEKFEYTYYDYEG